MTKSKGVQFLEELGAKNIEGYSLINNYGYTFEIEGKRYDVRYWANCYGVALNRWRTSSQTKTDDEKQICKIVNEKFNEIGEGA